MFHFEKYISSDYAIYYTLVKEDEVMRFITGKGMSAEEAKKKFDSIIEIGNEDDSLGYFKVLDNDTNLIGECKLVNYKKDPSLLEIGYLLRKDYWGNGLGTEICKKLLDLASVVASDRDIIGIIDPENLASKRILEKFDFKTYFKGLEDGVQTEKLILRSRA